MKKYFIYIFLMIFMSSCGMMFKNKPTHTKIVNNSNYNIEILNHNSNIIEKLEPNKNIVVSEKQPIQIRDKDGKICKVPRNTNGGVVAADILASLFIPIWPITIPLVWIIDTTGGYLKDNIPYIETSHCFFQ